MAARLLLLFIVAPVIELWLLIKVGGLIGVIPTIALVLLTAVIGSQLVRRQGLEVMQRIRAAQAHGEAPALPVLNGAALLLAGLFLITPGFLSDTLGFLLLVPKLRERIARALLSRVVIMTPGGMAGAGRRSPFGRDDSTIEGEYRRKSDVRDAANDRISRDD
ncbi:MAG: FxsA family protein [Salinisphaera sp.]|jgi:UPF0716 protein FxsA|nr:FxsA family protein [Salinisphaera sp.]